MGVIFHANCSGLGIFCGVDAPKGPGLLDSRKLYIYIAVFVVLAAVPSLTAVIQCPSSRPNAVGKFWWACFVLVGGFFALLLLRI